MTMRDRDQQTQAPGSRRPQKRKGMVVLLLFIIVVFLAITSLANRWRGELLVERLDIRGNRILTEKELGTLARVPLGTPLYDVELLEVRGRVRLSPYVADAVIAHDLPATIRITIRERKPVAILGGQESFFVSAEGYVLPPVNSKEVFDLPIITGAGQSQPVKVGTRITSENFKVAVQILSEAAALDRDLYHLISEINIESLEPTLYVAEQGIPVFFRRDSIRTQLVHFLSFWNQYVRQQGSERVRSVDLRFDGQVVVNWNKPSPQEESL
jgi:cell division septal protein FtsQ